MPEATWSEQKVRGRDEVLRAAQERAVAYSDRAVQDLRDLMNDYEVDVYRIVLEIGKRYGMDTAYEIMSETVAEKRLKWVDQNADALSSEGSDLERAMDLVVKYFRPGPGELEIVENTEHRVVFRRKEFVNAISHTCGVLGLDVVEVNNKVYASATNRMLERINPALRHVVLGYDEGWYEEAVERQQSPDFEQNLPRRSGWQRETR